MKRIGAMNMPENFKYKAAHLTGRPKHEKNGDFWRRHIPMDPMHRAKIFAPFDALCGFDEAIAAKEIPYTDKKDPDADELNRKLSEISQSVQPVTVRIFVPAPNNGYCNSDPEKGIYKAITGTVSDIDPMTETLRIDGQRISFGDILNIE